MWRGAVSQVAMILPCVTAPREWAVPILPSESDGWVARLLWAKSPTAACGGCREGDFGAAVEMRRSEQRASAFRAPQEGDQSNTWNRKARLQLHISRCGAVGSALALGACLARIAI